jgi:hypothetical protein
MSTEQEWYNEDERQTMKDIRCSAEKICQHSEQICNESAIIREIAREIIHMSQLARQRRRKQHERLSPVEKS